MDIECGGPIDLSSIESKYKLFFECALDMVFLIDISGRILDVNYAAIKGYGYSHDELLSMNIRDIRVRGERDIAEKQLREAFEKGYVYETVHIRKNGSTFPVEISSRGIIVENQNLLLAIVRDITKRNEAMKSTASLAAIVESSDDAILGISMEGIVTDWNHGAEAIYGYGAEEMRGRSVEILIPEDHSGELSQILGVIRQGRSLQHFDTERIRKDGTRIMVSLTASPIKGPGGELLGVSWISRDVTEQKRVKEALDKRLLALTEPLGTMDVSFTDLFNLDEIQKIQDAFAETMNVASIITYPDGTPITRPSNFRRLCIDIIRKTQKGCANCFRSDAIIGRKNPEGPIIQPCLSGGLWDAGASITVGGKHIANWLIGQVKNEAIDEKKIMLYADEIGADKAAFKEALREVPVMSIDRFEEIANFLFILAKELSLKAYQNVQQARFITERKQKEEYLKFIEFTINNWSDGTVWVTPDARIIFVNDAACRMLGYTKNELLSMKVFGFTLIHKESDWTGHWDELKKMKSLTFEGNFRKKDGSIFPVEVSANYVNYGGKEFNCALVKDITARKHAESVLEKTNRALRAVSRCNEAMIHIREEPVLLHAICDIIVDVGGYRMAWIGYALDDAGKTVQPMAKAGYEQGYIEKVKVSWADVEHGRGPAGTAIRTKKPSVIKNVTSSPTFAPWHAEAIKRGYASVIGLPLVTNDQALGVLTIYSEKTDVFDEDEIALLQELADDLAFGITSIRGRIEREHAEGALLESEERLRLAQQVAHIGTFELNLRTGMNKWTPELETMYGLPRGGFPGTLEDWERLVYPEDRPEAVRRVNEAIKNDDFEGEWRVVWPDGTVHWLYGRGHVFKDKTGKPLRLLGVNIDITERKRAEEALRESEVRFKQLADSSPMPLALYDLDGNILYVNKKLTMTYGYTPEDTPNLKKWWPQAYPDPSYRQKVFEQWTERVETAVRESKEIEPMEAMVTGKDGSIHRVEFTGATIGNMKMVILQDITERKRAEERLQLTQFAVDHFTDSAIWLDPSGRIIYVNDATCRSTGYNRSELLAMHIWDIDPLYSPEVLARNWIKWEGASGHQAENHFESVHRTKSGKIFPVEITGNIFSFMGQKYFVTYDRDITERKRAEEALKDAKAQAELYLDLMSHDITNMNQALMGYMEMMEVLQEAGEIDEGLIENSIEIINRSSGMISDVKKLTQLQAGKIPPTDVDVCEILSEVKAQYTNVPGRLVTINYTPGRDCIVRANSLLKNVFDNLVDNAIRHSTGPVTIDISIARVTLEGHLYYRITVADTGPGIPDDLKNKIFLDLKEIGEKTTRRGFGLYLVRTLINYYHGQVEVEDRIPGDPTKGAKFIVILPVAAK